MGPLDNNNNIGTILFMVALLFVCVFIQVKEHELQPKEETPTVNTQESSKENTLNLNCTALENGEYLCKKPK